MPRFRPIRQNDAMQCGQACLAMICTHHGRPITVSEIDSVCRFTREGLSVKGLSDGASALGLDSVCAAVSVEQLEECPLPCILHWNGNHFVVLYKIRHRRF